MEQKFNKVIELFKKETEKECYKIIAVVAPRETRLERIIQRDGISRKRAEERINAQLGEEYYKEHSDFVITNDGKEDVEKQLLKIVENIL